MASIDVKTAAGKKAGTATLDGRRLRHRAQRAGDAPGRHRPAGRPPGRHPATKTRAEVRGGGAKPWRQKGTGRARQGSTRAPHWPGGGVALGPKPRSYRQRTPKKMIRLALRSALSDRATEGKVMVVETGASTPQHQGRRRRPGRARRRGQGARGPDGDDDGRLKSFRNLPEVHIIDRRRAQHLRRPGQRLGRVHPGHAARRRSPPADADRHGGGRRVKDPRDVIIKPVVSEKSYGCSTERLHVHRPPRRQQARDPRRRRGDLRRQGHQGEHAEPPGQAQAQPPHRHLRASAPTPSAPSSPSPRATDRPVRGAEAWALRKRKPTSPGRRFQTVSDFSEITKDHAREVAARPRRARPVAATTTAARPPATAAAATSSSTASSTSSGTRTACPAKVAAIEYDPNRNCRIAPAALPRRREALHPRPRRT